MLKNTSIVLSALLCSLVLFELFLGNTPFAHGTSPVVYDADIGMWHKRNFSGRRTSACFDNRYYLNDQGLVDSSVKYDSGLKDIIVLGDSYVEALMVRKEGRLANRLSKAYESKLNVLNYGLAGTSPIQQYVILDQKVNLENTKLVVQIVNVESDLRDAVMNARSGVSRPLVFLEFDEAGGFDLMPPKPFEFSDWVRDKLGLLESFVFLKKAIYHTRKNLSSVLGTEDKKRGNRPEVETIDLEKNWVQLNGVIAATNKLLRAVGVKYVVIFNSRVAENSDRVAQFLEDQDILYFDLRSYLDDQGISYESLLYECDRHWSAAGHGVVFKGLQDTILGNLDIVK